MNDFWPEWPKSDDKGLARYVLPKVAESVPVNFNRFDYLQSRRYYDLVRGIYDALLSLDLRYAYEPPHPHPAQQILRDPRRIRLGAQEGTCIDLALLFAGLCLGMGLVPLVVLIEGHALAAVSLRYRYDELKKLANLRADPNDGDGPWTKEGILRAGDADTLKTLIDGGYYLAVECTGFARSNVVDPTTPEGRGRIDGWLDFTRAIEAGREQLDVTSRPFLFAIDPAILQETYGYTPYMPPTGRLPKLVKQFDGLFDEHRLFAGRDEKLHRLTRFVRPGAKGHLLVMGASGIGKTALLVNWIRLLLGREDLRVVYHVISRKRQSAGENQMLRSLCQQLIAFHGIADPIPSQLDDLRLIYQELVTEHAAWVPLVIVLDGLDEAEGWSPNTRHVPKDLPDNVFFVVSARPVAGRDYITELGLEQSAPELLNLKALSKAGVAALLRAAGSATAALADKLTFLELLHRKTAGDPLYLRFAIPDIAAGKYADESTLDTLPPKLNDYLKDWWSQISTPVGSEGSVGDLIGYLTAALGALNRKELIEISSDDRLNGQNIDFATGLVDRFLVGNERDGFEISHVRFREFIAGRYGGDELDDFRQRLLSYCRRWRMSQSRYAIRFLPQHLLDELNGGDGSLTNAALDELVEVLASEDFWKAHVERLGDFIDLDKDLREALHRTTRLSEPVVQPVVKLALAVWGFRRQWVSARPLLDAARRGELQEAERRLELFEADVFWRQAALLLVAWRGADVAPSAAHVFLESHADELDPSRLEYPLLRDRILAELGDGPPAALRLPYDSGALPEQVNALEASTIVDRLGGLESDPVALDTLLHHRGLTMGTDPEGAAYVTEKEAPHLVAFANKDPTTGGKLLRQYIAIHASNPYREYRNRALQGILGAVLCLDRPGEVRDMLEILVASAFRPGGVPYREPLLIVTEALAAAGGDDHARDALDQRRKEALNGIKTLRNERYASDTWGHHCRRLALLAEAYAIALQDGMTATMLLEAASELPRGFAGFQAPASLTLAEAALVVGGRLDLRDKALERASRSARRVQEPLFCALTTARVNSIIKSWWEQPIESVSDVLESFVDRRDEPGFASLYIVGDHPIDRGPDMIRFPEDMASARTIKEIAQSVFRVAVSDIERLNPQFRREEILAIGTPIRIPDPGLTPLLAQRFAAEVLARRDVVGPKRVALIARLVPCALSNETALHIVLARMLLTLARVDAAMIGRSRSFIPSIWMDEPVDREFETLARLVSH